MVKNLPSRAGDVGLIPGQATENPHATRQLSPCAATEETQCSQINSFFFNQNPTNNQAFWGAFENTKEAPREHQENLCTPHVTGVG